MDEFKEAGNETSHLMANDDGVDMPVGDMIRIRCCDFLFKLLIILERRVLRKLQPNIEEFLKDEFFIVQPGRQRGIKIVEYLKKRLKDKLLESLELDFLEDEETRAMRLKAKRKNYSYFEGDTEEESSDMSDLDEEQIEGLTFNNKLMLKIEAKIEKLERHLNEVPTKEDKLRFLKLYLAKEDNFIIVLTLITRPHDFECKTSWKVRSDISKHPII